MPIAKIEAALDDIRRGKMVILVDDEDRENEGDLVIAAEKVTPEAINFMAKEGRGLICLSMTEARADELDLPLMVSNNSSSFGTAFTVSIEARRGVTTGISAADRSHTIQVAVADDTTARDLARPGHVSRYGRKRVVSWCVPDRLKAQLIWHVWRALSRLGLFVKS